METNSNSPLRNRRRCPPNPGRRGIANIWVALLALVLIGLTGLACDAAYVLLVVHQLQNAADAAALAGAQHVRLDVEAAWQATLDMALRNHAGGEPVRLTENLANEPTGDIVIGRFWRQTGKFTPTFEGPNAVKVVARRAGDSLGGAVPLFFGSVFGVKTISVERMAIAMAGGGTGAGILVLNPNAEKALIVSNDAIVTCNGGTIHVNSSYPYEAVRALGNVVINANINVLGGATFSGTATLNGDLNTLHVARFLSGTQHNGLLNPGPPPVFLEDPLAWLPTPTPGAPIQMTEVRPLGTEAVRLGPGYYPAGINLANNSTKAVGGGHVLEPGLYIVDGIGFYIGSNCDVTAEGVTIYVMGTGRVYMGGGGAGTTTMTPAEWGVYTGITIFQNNTRQSNVLGNGTIHLSGTLYFRQNRVVVSGNGNEALGNQLIADTLVLQGDRQISIQYDGRFPSPGNKPFLVY